MIKEISKKELLKITGISYGQLYRWKRQGLIPEEWFVKRSTRTGQETFFPKSYILDRINKILELKDVKTLDEIKDIIYNQVTTELFKKVDVKKHNLIDTNLWELVSHDTLTFNELFLLKCIDYAYQPSMLVDELKKTYQALYAIKPKLLEDAKALIFIPKNEGLGFLLVTEDIRHTYNTEPLTIVYLQPVIEKLKLNLLNE